MVGRLLAARREAWAGRRQQYFFAHHSFVVEREFHNIPNNSIGIGQAQWRRQDDGGWNFNG